MRSNFLFFPLAVLLDGRNNFRPYPDGTLIIMQRILCVRQRLAANDICALRPGTSDRVILQRFSPRRIGSTILRRRPVRWVGRRGILFRMTLCFRRRESAIKSSTTSSAAVSWRCRRLNVYDFAVNRFVHGFRIISYAILVTRVYDTPVHRRILEFFVFCRRSKVIFRFYDPRHIKRNKPNYVTYKAYRP